MHLKTADLKSAFYLSKRISIGDAKRRKLFIGRYTRENIGYALGLGKPRGARHNARKSNFLKRENDFYNRQLRCGKIFCKDGRRVVKAGKHDFLNLIRKNGRGDILFERFDSVRLPSPLERRKIALLNLGKRAPALLLGISGFAFEFLDDRGGNVAKEKSLCSKSAADI